MNLYPPQVHGKILDVVGFNGGLDVCDGCFVDVLVDSCGRVFSFGKIELNGYESSVYLTHLCRTFGVYDSNELIGKGCTLYRCWKTIDDSFEGISSHDTGEMLTRTTLYDFIGRKCKSPLDERRDMLKRRHDDAMAVLQETLHDLGVIDSDYIDLHRTW